MRLRAAKAALALAAALGPAVTMTQSGALGAEVVKGR